MSGPAPRMGGTRGTPCHHCGMHPVGWRTLERVGGGEQEGVSRELEDRQRKEGERGEGGGEGGTTGWRGGEQTRRSDLCEEKRSGVRSRPGPCWQQEGVLAILEGLELGRVGWTGSQPTTPVYRRDEARR